VLSTICELEVNVIKIKLLLQDKLQLVKSREREHYLRDLPINSVYEPPNNLAMSRRISARFNFHPD